MKTVCFILLGIAVCLEAVNYFLTLVQEAERLAKLEDENLKD